MHIVSALFAMLVGKVGQNEDQPHRSVFGWDDVQERVG